MTYNFNSKDISSFLLGLNDIQILSKMADSLKNSNNKNENVRYLSISQLSTTYLGNEHKEYSYCQNELKFICLILMLMLGFLLKDSEIINKRIEQFRIQLKNKNVNSDSEEGKKVLNKMNSIYKYFESLNSLYFGNKNSLKENDAEINPEKLNVLSLEEIKAGNLSKGQILLKRALLRANVNNKKINLKNYFDEIYNVNTETAQKNNNINAEWKQSSFHDEDYLLYNSAMVLIKRRKFLEASEILSKLEYKYKHNFNFWYRFGQVSKEIFLEDVFHVSSRFDSFFHARQKQFFAGEILKKSKKQGKDKVEETVEDFMNYIKEMNNKNKIKNQTNNQLHNIINRRQMIKIIKAKNLIGLTKKLYGHYTKNICKKTASNKKGNINVKLDEVNLNDHSLSGKSFILNAISELKTTGTYNKYEMNYLKKSINCFNISLSIIKKELENKFKPILAQLKIYNTKSMNDTYKRHLKYLINFLISVYENLSFLYTLDENYSRAIQTTNEGLNYIANIEQAIFGFDKTLPKRLIISLKKNFTENFKTKEFK